MEEKGNARVCEGGREREEGMESERERERTRESEGRREKARSM